MEKKMNMLIYYLLIFQAVMYLFSMSGSGIWNRSNIDNLSPDFLYLTYSLSLETFLMIPTYFILYNTMLPISLIVSLEIVKVVQSWFITQDDDFYMKEKDKKC